MKEEERDLRKLILEFKPSTLQPPLLDKIQNFINEENVIVASMIPYVAFLSSLYVVFVTSVDKNAGDDELICSNTSVLLQSLIILSFLIPLVYFKNNRIIWKKWINYVVNNSKNKKKKGDKSQQQQQQQQQQEQEQEKEWLDFAKFSDKESWYENMKLNVKTYLFSLLIYLFLCCYTCATLFECTIGTQGTNIMIFILILSGLIYFMIGMRKKLSQEDSEKMLAAVTQKRTAKHVVTNSASFSLQGVDIVTTPQSGSGRTNVVLELDADGDSTDDEKQDPIPTQPQLQQTTAIDKIGSNGDTPIANQQSQPQLVLNKNDQAQCNQNGK